MSPRAPLSSSAGSAARHGNRLGIVTFGNGSDNVMPPAGGRKGMLSLLRALADEPAEEGGGVTSPARALTLVGARRRRRQASS